MEEVLSVFAVTAICVYIKRAKRKYYGTKVAINAVFTVIVMTSFQDAELRAACLAPGQGSAPTTPFELCICGWLVFLSLPTSTRALQARAQRLARKSNLTLVLQGHLSLSLRTHSFQAIG